MKKCGHCGRSIAGKRAGAKWCSTSCRVMAARARKRFPVEMTSTDRWVSWKPVLRGERWTKVPVTVDGRPASTRGASTWTSFDNVKTLTRKGWVLGAGIGCLDLDKCLVDGVLADWARKVVEEHMDEALLIEVSPSGTGVHVFLPMGTGKGNVIRDGRNIEVYPPDSGRYICVTGNRLQI